MINFNIHKFFNKTPFKNNNKEKVNIKNRYNTNPTKSIYKRCLHKLKPYALAGLITYGGINACTDNNINGTTNLDGIKIEYTDIKPQTKVDILEPLLQLKKQLTPETDFLKNIKISVVNSVDELDNSDDFNKYVKLSENSEENAKGYSLYSDGKLQKRILIQESAHNDDKIYNLIRTGNYNSDNAIKQSLMHEVGHQFDQFFGHDHEADFAKEWDSINATRFNDPQINSFDFPSNVSTQKSKVTYDLNCALSDKNKFYYTMIDDLKNIAKLKKLGSDELANNIDYYLSFIDLNAPINYEAMELADATRAEVYANLFSYAIGQDDGDKAKFTKNFANSYKLVKKDIIKYLHIIPK
ncbi:MAG: hypothetical protein LKG27_01565 [Clostridiaceae bacterium]|jgi:hypothetical protein|nr:hypothetical protein [Clostridiaceae bacterium]